MNAIHIDLNRTISPIDRNIFGGFAEHLGRCIYGGIYEPGSPLSDDQGLRTDVLSALRRLNMPVMRYPGGNFVSGYRWRDGVGPKAERQARQELAWHDIEPNTFGTNEFVHFCRQINSEPYLAVNCGDGDMREARDWVEYCNGTLDSSLVKLRRNHGYEAPHNVKYWGIGNEVDGQWQIGHKTPEEYARAYTEFAKVMKWTDPTIQLFASATCHWRQDFVERAQLLLEHAPTLIDYMAVHWYVGNRSDDFNEYMGISEQIEDRLSAYAGLIKALRLANKIEKPIPIAVDEWNVWYRVRNEGKLEEIYNLEDALVVALQMNAFIRHADTVKMANLAQIVNVIAPIMTRPDGLVLQSIFHPFELYSRHCGDTALDLYWDTERFDAGQFGSVRVLDVAGSLKGNQLALFVVNRSHDSTEAQVRLAAGRFAGPAHAYVVNGPHIKAENTFDTPNQVGVTEQTLTADGSAWTITVEPHSVTVLVAEVAA